MSKVSTLLLSFRNKGLRATLRSIYYGYFVVNKFIVFYRDLAQPTREMEIDPEVELKRVSLVELEQLRSGNSNFPPDFYCDRTYGFSTPCVALVGGELAAILWIVSPHEYSRFLELGEGDAEYNYSFVLPQYRGHRLAARLMALMIDICRQQQQRRLFAVVSATNIPQFKQMLAMGFVPVEALTHFGLRRPKATLEYVK